MSVSDELGAEVFDPSAEAEVYDSPADRALFPPAIAGGQRPGLKASEVAVIWVDLRGPGEAEPYRFTASLYGEPTDAPVGSLAEALYSLAEEALAREGALPQVVLADYLHERSRSVVLARSPAFLAIEEAAAAAHAKASEKRWRLDLTVCIDLEAGVAYDEAEAEALAETLAGKLGVWLDEEAGVAEVTVPEREVGEIS